MNDFIIKTGEKCVGWAFKNPKQFYVYSLLFLSASFVGVLIQGIFFPSDMTFKIRTPVLYSKSSVTPSALGNNNKQMEKIVQELKTLKGKRDRDELKHEDSLRIEYLFNQYQHLKNGH